MDKFMSKRYPSQIKAAGSSCDVIFFPIEDFRITAGEDVVAVVLHLRQRLRRGERLYVHCRSGHGRTGMVAIPLVASIFDIPVSEASIFVQRAHDIGRNGGNDAGWRLPETSEQEALVESIGELVRQSDIAPGSGSSSSSSRRR